MIIYFRLILLAVVILPIQNGSAQTNFLKGQKRYQRVRTAIKEKGTVIKHKLKENKLSPENLNILFVAYKAESELDLYVKSPENSTYKKLKTYSICAKSGNLGPKLKQGDQQVPEGFYHIDRFNPVSSYYLSLGINYPNKADKVKSKVKNLGGDIFIHGNCVTIGCLPMTDENIKEIFLYAVYAKNNGQQEIPVYIFPFNMNSKNCTHYRKKNKTNSELLDFWNNLKLGWDNFDKNKTELTIKINKEGNYIFKKT